MTPELNSEEIVGRCIEICQDRKAEKIAVYDVRGISVLTDFYLFCNSNSRPHLRAIASHIEKTFKELGIRPRAIEGSPSSQWILMDYLDVLVHVFHPEARDYYAIEQLLDADRRIYPEEPAPSPDTATEETAAPV